MQSMPITVMAELNDDTHVVAEAVLWQHKEGCDCGENKYAVELAIGGDEHPQIVIGTDLLGVEKLIHQLTTVRDQLLKEVLKEPPF